MILTQLARALASSDPAERRRVLLEHLPVFIHRRQRFEADGQAVYPENIIVPPPRDAPRLLLGAHYDATPGSAGANDNASGVAVLLYLIKAGYTFDAPLEFAFFDLEKQRMAGSRAYLHTVDMRSVRGLIHLNCCGIGDTLLVTLNEPTQGTPYQSALHKAITEAQFPVHPVALLPPSDDVVFQRLRVPIISLSVVPTHEIAPLEAYAQARHAGQAAPPPAFLADTTDPPDNLSEDALWMVTYFLLSLMGHIKALAKPYG